MPGALAAATLKQMRRHILFLSVACCLGGVLAACGASKRPAPASEDPNPSATGDGNDSGAAVATIDAGPAPQYCLDVPEGGVPADCRCSITDGIVTVPVACGLALCSSLSTSVQICDYDGKVKVVPNIPFSVCTGDAGIPPCTANASDGGSNDASDDAG